jgi:hypothetical protein
MRAVVLEAIEIEREEQHLRLGHEPVEEPSYEGAHLSEEHSGYAPPGSRPDIGSFAIIPATNPKTIQLRTPKRLLLEAPAYLRLLCSIEGRLY